MGFVDEMLRMSGGTAAEWERLNRRLVEGKARSLSEQLQQLKHGSRMVSGCRRAADCHSRRLKGAGQEPSRREQHP